MPAPGAAQRAAQKFIVFENFEKMNTQSVRQALSEKELAWLENLQPIAPNNLTTVPGPLAPLIANIGKVVLSMFYAAIGSVDYLIAFTTSGAAFGINIATGVANQFAPDGTFSGAPDLTTWQASRVVINDSVAGYCTWDGTVFVKQGGVAPFFGVSAGGSGYSSPPPVTISGGSGTGATAVAVLSGGSVVAVNLTNPGVGYKVGDSITVSFGTGVGAGAAGHVTMSGFPVAAVTIANPGGFVTPAPGTYALTFSGGGGAGASGTATVVPGGGFGLNTVSSVNLTAGGSYTSTPTCTLSTTGGAAPSFNVFLGTETVASIVLDASGGGYIAPPTVTISGGGATTPATAHATIAAGSVISLVLDTVGAGYTATPSVIIGTGSGAAAAGIIWPFVPKGTTIAVFQGRVWLGGGQLLQYTSTIGFADFNPAFASGSLTISDADLVHSITALRNFNNYLFIMGDQSVKQIGNISLNAAGNVTLFTILTLSSDQGTIYPRSCGSFNRVFMFANTNGVYAVFGSSVQKISDDLDGIFKLIDFSQSPQAALADINNIHNIMFLVVYKDPLASSRTILLTFNGKKWFVINQGNSIAAIATVSTLASGQIETFSSSVLKSGGQAVGSDITQILGDPTKAVTFKVQSSLTHHGNAVQRKKIDAGGIAVTLASGTGSVTVTYDTENGSTSKSYNLVAGFQTIGGASGIGGSGKYLGMTMTGTQLGFTLTNMALSYQETSLWT